MTEPMDTLSLPDIFWTLMQDEDEEDARLEENSRLEDKLWTMKNGKTIPIHKMSDHHLINTIAMVGDNSPWHKVLQEELTNRINKVPSVAKINIEEKKNG